jgi:ADP-ribose pyrophosphatase
VPKIFELLGAAMGKAKVSQPNQKAQILKSEMIYEGKAFGVRRDELIEPTGVRTVREVVTHPGSVVVLPVLADGKIVLVRQYRHATRQYLWELVAGRMEPGEDPKTGAARELLEETGYRGKKFSVFLDVFPTPGFLEERMYLLLAEGLTAGEAQPEEDEKLTVATYTKNQLEQMIGGGKLRDAKSIAGLLFYFRFLRKDKRRRR